MHSRHPSPVAQELICEPTPKAAVVAACRFIGRGAWNLEIGTWNEIPDFRIAVQVDLLSNRRRNHLLEIEYDLGNVTSSWRTGMQEWAIALRTAEANFQLARFAYRRRWASPMTGLAI